MSTEYPEWRTEQDLLADERCWSPIGGPPAPALPPRRLERSVQVLRRTSHGLQQARQPDGWELLYAQVSAGR